jgi:hypothetical protein
MPRPKRLSGLEVIEIFEQYKIVDWGDSVGKET